MNESAKVYLPRFPFEANAIRLEAFTDGLIRELNAHNISVAEIRLHKQQLERDWHQEYYQLGRVEKLIARLRDEIRILRESGEVLGARLDREAVANSDAAKQVEH